MACNCTKRQTPTNQSVRKIPTRIPQGQNSGKRIIRRVIR